MKKPLTALMISFIFVLLFSSLALANRLSVFVSILPQKYFLEKIGGDRIQTIVMVPPGANPATYEPKPRQMVVLSRSKAYFSIGVPFEMTWLPRISHMYKQLPIIQTDRFIAKRRLWGSPPNSKGTEPWARGPGKTEGLDPHVWTSPPLVMLQARNIMVGLSRIDPVNRDYYEANYRKFIIELVNLDLELRNMLLPQCAGRYFLVFHPSWGYFAETYGLRQMAIEKEGKPPGPGDLETLIDLAKRRHVNAVFVQPQFSRKSAQLVARAIGARVVSADPLAEDWAANLKRVAEELQNALH